VIDEVRDETIDLAINVLESILLKMAPITGLDFLALSALPDLEELKEWQDFETATMNFLCYMLGIQESWVWFEPVIHESGEPLGNGWGCSQERAPDESSVRNKKGHREPDFVLNSKGGLLTLQENGTKKTTSLLIGEIKYRISTFSRAYVKPGERRGQLEAIVNYTAEHTYSHLALFIAFRDGKDSEKRKLLKEATKARHSVLPVIVAIN